MDFTKKNLAASVVFAHRLNIYSKLSRKLCLKKSRYLKLSTRMSEGAAGAELASSLQVVPGVTTEPGFKPVSTVREKTHQLQGKRRWSGRHKQTQGIQAELRLVELRVEACLTRLLLDPSNAVDSPCRFDQSQIQKPVPGVLGIRLCWGSSSLPSTEMTLKSQGGW